jgi:hypothetical protein
MSFAVLFLVLFVLVGSGSMVATLGLMWNRIRQIEGGRKDGSELSNISQQLETVRDQLFLVEDEMARLNERVDFTEKLLEPPRVEPEKDEPSDTP